MRWIDAGYTWPPSYIDVHIVHVKSKYTPGLTEKHERVVCRLCSGQRRESKSDRMKSRMIDSVTKFQSLIHLNFQEPSADPDSHSLFRTCTPSLFPFRFMSLESCARDPLSLLLAGQLSVIRAFSVILIAEIFEEQWYSHSQTLSVCVLFSYMP